MPDQNINIADWLRLSDALGRQSWESWEQTVEELRARTERERGDQGAGGLVDQLWRMLWDTAGTLNGEETVSSEVIENSKIRIEQAFASLRSCIPPTAKPLANILAVWSRLLDPKDGEGPAQALGGTLPHLPKLGLLQHRQIEVERAVDALEKFRVAYLEYLGILESVTLEILDRWTTELVARTFDEDESTGLHSLYELWIEIGESAYERALGTEEYADTLSAMINAAMEVLRSTQAMIDTLTTLFNLPNRRDLISTQRRLHELRRRHFQLSDELEAADAESLRREVASLRKEVDALRVQGRPGRRSTRTQPGPERSRRS